MSEPDQPEAPQADGTAAPSGWAPPGAFDTPAAPAAPPAPAAQASGWPGQSTPGVHSTGGPAHPFGFPGGPNVPGGPGFPGPGFPGRPTALGDRPKARIALLVGVPVLAVLLLCVLAGVLVNARSAHRSGSSTATGSHSSTGSTSASSTASPGPSVLEQELRKKIAKQTGLTDDIGVKCPPWKKNGTSQDLDCTAVHAGQEIRIQVNIDGGQFLARFEAQQEKTFFSANAIRKAFEEDMADSGDTVVGCDDSMPAEAIVDFNMPLPYSCSSKSSAGYKYRYGMEIGELGITFTRK